MKLYEIDKAIMDCIDAATGEVFDAELLNQLNVERNVKIVKEFFKNSKKEGE